MSDEPKEAPEEELNDPGNEDPGSLMDDAQVPLSEPDDAADGGHTEENQH